MANLNQFNRIAFLYDFLVQLAFGNYVRRAQLEFIESLPAGTVLIIGGGTGWIAEPLLRRPGITIHYIEASDKMLERSKSRLRQFSERITFIHGTEGNIDSGEMYDAVITNFWVDLFSDDSLPGVCKQIQARMKSEARWIVTDFVNHSWWQGMYLFLMYRFFYFTCKIQATKLPSWEKILLKGGLSVENDRFFFGGFIRTVMYGNLR